MVGREASPAPGVGGWTWGQAPGWGGSWACKSRTQACVWAGYRLHPTCCHKQCVVLAVSTHLPAAHSPTCKTKCWGILPSVGTGGCLCLFRGSQSIFALTNLPVSPLHPAIWPLHAGEQLCGGHSEPAHLLLLVATEHATLVPWRLSQVSVTCLPVRSALPSPTLAPQGPGC